MLLTALGAKVFQTLLLYFECIPKLFTIYVTKRDKRNFDQNAATIFFHFSKMTNVV